MNKSDTNTVRRFSDLRGAYRERVFAPREVAFPGSSERLRVKLLSEAELDRCRVAAISYVKEHRIDTVVDRDDILDREKVRSIVWNSFLTLEDVKGEQARYFDTPSDLRDNIDAATLDRLYELYLDHASTIANASVPSESDLDAAIEAASRGGEPAAALFVRTFDPVALRALSLRLLEREREGGR